MRKHVLMLALAAGILGVVATACSDDDDPATSNADLVAAVNILDTAGLHGIDESINDDDEVPAGARTTALKLQATVALVDWPDELADSAESLGETFAALATALEGDEPDLAVAGPAATAAHDEAHDFSHAAWEYFYGEAGVEAEEGDDHS